MENKLGYYITVTNKRIPSSRFIFKKLVFSAPQFELAILSDCIFESLDVAIKHYDYLNKYFSDGIESNNIEIKIHERFTKS
jgi:hypothetical protein